MLRMLFLYKKYASTTKVPLCWTTVQFSGGVLEGISVQLSGRVLEGDSIQLSGGVLEGDSDTPKWWSVGGG